MTRWEYARVPMNGNEKSMVAHLNELGSEGWELVHVGEFFFTLKRQHRTPPPQAKAPAQQWTRVRCLECLETADPQCPMCRGDGWMVKR